MDALAVSSSAVAKGFIVLQLAGVHFLVLEWTLGSALVMSKRTTELLLYLLPFQASAVELASISFLEQDQNLTWTHRV